MSTGSPRVPRLVPHDVAALERRARVLAAERPGEDEGAALLRVVTFRLRGRACAVDAGAVLRAVARLPATVPIPIAHGGTRAAAFVDERPVPVADLAGAVADAPRAPEALEGAPALLVAGAQGPLAVVVEGPLELAEEPLVAAAEDTDGDRLRLAGQLAGGAVLVDAEWLAGWAAKAVAP